MGRHGGEREHGHIHARRAHHYFPPFGIDEHDPAVTHAQPKRLEGPGQARRIGRAGHEDHTAGPTDRERREGNETERVERAVGRELRDRTPQRPTGRAGPHHHLGTTVQEVEGARAGRVGAVGDGQRQVRGGVRNVDKVCRERTPERGIHSRVVGPDTQDVSAHAVRAARSPVGAFGTRGARAGRVGQDAHVGRVVPIVTRFARRALEQTTVGQQIHRGLHVGSQLLGGAAFTVSTGSEAVPRTEHRRELGDQTVDRHVAVETLPHERDHRIEEVELVVAVHDGLTIDNDRSHVGPGLRCPRVRPARKPRAHDATAAVTSSSAASTASHAASRSPLTSRKHSEPATTSASAASARGASLGRWNVCSARASSAAEGRIRSMLVGAPGS